MADTADGHKTGKSIVVDNKMVCKACSKRVYELEKLVMGDVTYHKTCFRCQNCNCVLRLNNFAALNGKNYCKPHFIEAFKLKGNYVSGFADDEDEKAKARKGDDATNKPSSDSGQPATIKPVVAANKPASNGQVGEKPLHQPVTVKSVSLPMHTKEEGAPGSGDHPSQGITRQRVAQLNKQMSEERTDSSAASKAAPPRGGENNVTRNMLKKFESMNSGGDVQGQAATSTHKESTTGRRPSHDMPASASDTTRNMLAKFRSMEDQTRAPAKTEDTKKAGGSRGVSREASTDTAKPEDIANDPDSSVDAEDDYLQLKPDDDDDDMDMGRVKEAAQVAVASKKHDENAVHHVGQGHEKEDEHKGHTDDSDKSQGHNYNSEEMPSDEYQSPKDHSGEDKGHNDRSDEGQDQRDHSNEHKNNGDYIGKHEDHGDLSDNQGLGNSNNTLKGHGDQSDEHVEHGIHSSEDEGHRDHNEGHGDHSEGHGDHNEGHGDQSEGHGDHSEGHKDELKVRPEEHSTHGHGDGDEAVAGVDDD